MDKLGSHPNYRSDALSTRMAPAAKFCASVMGAVLLLVGCSNPEQSKPGSPVVAENIRQTAFRIRADADAPLNANTGWAANINKPAVVQVDQPFRVRFEVESKADIPSAHRFQLQFRRNRGEWEPLTAEDFPYPLKKHELDFSSLPTEPVSGAWNIIQGNESALSWQQENGDGFLHVETDKNPVLALGRYATQWEAVEFAAAMRLPQHSAAGIVFGYKDENNYFYLNVEAGGAISIVRRAMGEEAALATHNVGVKADQWIEVAIIRNGSELTIEYEWDDYIKGLEFTEDLGEIIPESRFGFYLPANTSADFESFEIEGETHSPRVSIISSQQFGHGLETHDVLPESQRLFAGGAGISYADTIPIWSAANAHGEWEFPLVIRYFSDGAAQNEAGDRFEFRMVSNAGKPLKAKRKAMVTLAVPDGHLGGTFVETPGRIGPWEASNGDLYFLMEPAETDNMPMIVKSTDGGKSWREVDGENRPDTGDLEGVATTFVDGKIHILHQISEHVFHHMFRTSDHPTQPDTWAIRDERLASPTEPPVQVADIAVRSDASVVGVYGNLEKVLFRVRSPEGQWGEETVVDPEVETTLSGPVLVRGKNDTVHFAYTGIGGTAWYRQILPNGELTPRQQVASNLGTEVEDAGSILPLVYLPELDSVSIIYRVDNGQLWERRVNGQGELSDAVQVTDRAVVQNAADSEQAGADAAGYGSSVHVLFIEEGTGHIFHTYRINDGTWTDATLQVDGVDALWVRGTVVKETEKGAAYGYVYDAGSYGGSGFNRYAEVPLQSN